MASEQGDGFNLDDRDRLPWLEPAEDMADYERVPVQKVAALVLIGLALLGLIIGGGWWYKSRMGRSGGDVALIPAPQGDYKIPAPDPQAREFAGEGDAAYSASEGGEAAGRIDPSKAPEAPMAFFDEEDFGSGDEDGAEVPAPAASPSQAAAKAPAARATPPAPRPTATPSPARPAATPTPRDTPKAIASAPIKEQARASAPIATSAPSRGNAPASGAVAGGARIQLGAYNSEGIAKEAWKRLVKRFEELGTANYSVEPVTSGGKTLYRLRMGTGSTSEANAVCGRLRVAGENCWVVR